MAGYKKQVTTSETAAELGIKPKTFRRWAERLELVPEEVVLTGKRGRPEYLWTRAQVSAIRTARS